MEFLEFEKPAQELSKQIASLRAASDSTISVANEIQTLEKKLEQYLHHLYRALSPWQTVQVARHSQRPQTSEIFTELCDTFVPLCGDRCFGDDLALLGGLARFRDRNCIVLGTQKGRSTQERLHHNFGMARPEGYRKAIRLMQLAEKFSLPILTFVDTAGAYPGVEAEARGQAQAIASAIRTCLSVTVPVISTIVGEGGSGGAIAIAAADRVLMLEHAIYSVISPEGCATILWHDAKEAEKAASQMKLTAKDALSLGAVDRIINEPIGGAHRDPKTAIARIGDAIATTLKEVETIDGSVRRYQRQQRYLTMAA